MLEDTEFYSVQTAQDGESAINLLKQQTFDLLVTDYNMPRMNGYELFKKCKSISSNLPVILITGNNFNGGVIENIKSQGNIECIYKPFDAYILFETVLDLIFRTNT